MLGKFWNFVDYYLEQKWFIITLIFLNLFGLIYGLTWYKEQLLENSLKLLIFIPDGPLASLFFVIFLMLYLFGKRVPIIEALAAVSLFKYGLWTIMVVIWGGWANEASLIKMLTLETIGWTGVLLILTHILMILQAILFYKKYSFGFWSIIFAGFWLLTNDFLDYTLNIHPLLPESISSLDYKVGKFTFYISGFTLLLFYFLSILRRKDE